MTLTIHKSGSADNPAIIFLHGLGVSSWMWHDQIEALKEDYYCMAIDLPGNGESYQVEWDSFAGTCELIAGIIQTKIPTKKAHIVGLSLGGYTALTLLAHHPEVVESVIVSGVSTQPFPKQWFYRPLVRLISKTIAWDTMINLNAKMMGFPADILPLYRQDSKRLSQLTLKRVYDEVLNFKMPAKLNNNTHRLLAVAGDKEAKMVLNGLADFAGISHTTTAIAPNAHHGWNGEHPALFTEMVQAWIENTPLPASLFPQSTPKEILTTTNTIGQPT